MPRAVDPSLNGGGLKVDHSPLNRIAYGARKPDGFSVDELIEGAKTFVTDYLFPTIEGLTGIDLSAFLPLLNLLDLDFSSPTAFLTSLINSIVALPAVLIQLLSSLIEQLTHPGNSDLLTSLISGIIELLVSLPTLLIQLAEGLIESGAGLLGLESPLNALNLFNLVPTSLLGQIDIAHIGKSITNLLTDPNFLDVGALSVIPGWTHDLTGGFGGTGAMSTTANGTLKELFGNLIPVSEGQIVPLSGMAKWTGLSNAPPNLAVSPGFEDPTVTRWYGGTYSTEEAHTGTHSYKMQGLGVDQQTNLHLSANTVHPDDPNAFYSVQPGDKYYVEIWVKGKSSNIGDVAGPLSMWNIFHNSVTDAYTWLPFDAGAISSIPNSAGGTPWTKLSGYITTPTGFNQWHPYTSFYMPTTDYAYIDDIVIRKEQAAPPTDPIQLGVTGYLNGSPTVQQTIASHNATPPTTDWLTLSGTYTVPANVDSLRTRLVVAPQATAGTVSFSKMSVTKIGAMLQTLIRGTNAGEFLPDDIGHLFGGIITNATALLEKAGLGDFNDLLATIGGSFGTDLAAAEARLEDFLHSLSPLNADHISSGTILDDFVPGIGGIHDNIVAAVGNLTGGGFDLTKVFEVLTGQTHAVVDAAAGVTNMFGRLSILESKVAALPVSAGGTGSGNADGGLVGANDYDNFERVNSASLGTDWLQYYNGAGKWAIPNGHDAEFVGSGTGNTEFIAIRNSLVVPRSQTNYQRVTLELSSKATRMYDALFGTYNYCGFNDIWLRVSDATTSLANVTGIRIRYGGDGGLTIHQFVNGTPTLLNGLGTGGIAPPGPGANLIGEAGVLADGAPLVIRAKLGASVRLQANSTLTPGSTLRRWGHGGRAEGHVLPIPARQEEPGGAHYWAGQDQTLT